MFNGLGQSISKTTEPVDALGLQWSVSGRSGPKRRKKQHGDVFVGGQGWLIDMEIKSWSM